MGYCACAYGGRACWNGAADQATQLCLDCMNGRHPHQSAPIEERDS